MLFNTTANIYGRKWSFKVNSIVFVDVLMGFAKAFTSFMWAQNFYDTVADGAYSSAAVLALDDCLPAACSLFSGMLEPLRGDDCEHSLTR